MGGRIVKTEPENGAGLRGYRSVRPAFVAAVMLITASMMPPVPTVAQDATKGYERQEDVIYGRKHGMALTMDVFTPKAKANGKGVIFVVSGGWFSAHQSISLPLVEPLVARGYTVFAVVHGSQPRFTIPEAVADLDRSVRFIRHNAKRFGIDPDAIGIYGASAGCHLSLMQGLAGKPGALLAADPVDRTSSRVQAVAGFFPPTDFLNYGKEGVHALGDGVLENFAPPFDFQTTDPKTKRFVSITDEDKRIVIGKQISPITHVSPDDPPVLLFHGDADKLVPIQQSQSLMVKLKEAKIPNKLITKPGEAHGWKQLPDDVTQIADWFDAHLKSKAAP